MYNMDYQDYTDLAVDKYESLCEVHLDGIETAETLCINCNKKMCNVCIKYHRRFHKDHEVTQLNDMPAPFECKHKDQMKVYCTKCDTPLCSICRSRAHSGHRIESINNVVEKTKRIYKEIQGNCSGEYVGRLKQRSENHREECEQTKQHISDFVEGLITTINMKKEEMFKQSEMIAREKKIVLEQQLTLIERQREVLEQVPRLLQLSHSPQLTWLTQRKILQSTLHATRHDKTETYIFSPNNEIENYLDVNSLGCLEKLSDNEYDETNRDGDYNYPSSLYLDVLNPVQQRTPETTPGNKTATRPDQFYDETLKRSEKAVDRSTGTASINIKRPYGQSNTFRNSQNIQDKSQSKSCDNCVSNIADYHVAGDSSPDSQPRGQKEHGGTKAVSMRKLILQPNVIESSEYLASDSSDKLDEIDVNKHFLDDLHIYDEPDESSSISCRRLPPIPPPKPINKLPGPSTRSRTN